jgi:hypothetical protein
MLCLFSACILPVYSLFGSKEAREDCPKAPGSGGLEVNSSRDLSAGVIRSPGSALPQSQAVDSQPHLADDSQSPFTCTRRSGFSPAGKALH